MTENNWKSSQWPEQDLNQGTPYCESNAVTTRPAWGWGGGGCTFLKSPILVPLKRLVFVTRKPGKWEVEACGFLFFFQGGGGGLGLRDMCVCTQWQGSLQRRESVTEHENGVCESVHLYCTQRFTFSPKCFIPVATVRNETVTLTITSTWMSTASQL